MRPSVRVFAENFIGGVWCRPNACAIEQALLNRIPETMTAFPTGKDANALASVPSFLPLPVPGVTIGSQTSETV